MNLINISVQSENNKQTVNARELHGFLESKQEFSTWIKSRVKKYGFLKGVDFLTIDKTIKREKGASIRRDFHVSLNMAKELSMLERNPKGKAARRYFIECEEKTNLTPAFQLPQTFADALLLAGQQAKQLEAQNLQIEQQRPAVEYCQKVSATSGSLKIRDFAKSISKDGLTIGQNKLFAWLRNNGFLTYENTPYQKYINNGYFELITGIIERSTTGRQWQQTRITGKGQIAVTKKLLSAGALS